MECERFKRLFKSWYLQVQDEALAPARMVELMENHISECPVCIMDPEVRQDMKKIITLVLPQDKLKIASRSNRKKSPDDPVHAEADGVVDDETVVADEDGVKDEVDDDDDDVVVDPDVDDPLV